MQDFGRRECLGMHRRGLLQLERGLSGDGEAGATPGSRRANQPSPASRRPLLEARRARLRESLVGGRARQRVRRLRSGAPQARGQRRAKRSSTWWPPPIALRRQRTGPPRGVSAARASLASALATSCVQIAAPVSAISVAMRLIAPLLLFAYGGRGQHELGHELQAPEPVLRVNSTCRPSAAHGMTACPSLPPGARYDPRGGSTQEDLAGPTASRLRRSCRASRRFLPKALALI